MSGDRPHGPLLDDVQRTAHVRVQRRKSLGEFPVQYPDSGAVQLIPDRVELPWTEVDLSRLDPGTRARRFDELIAADRGTRFDLTAAPAIRMTLVKFGAGDYRLVVTNHHILLDGWSTPLVIRDLLTLYATDADASVLPRVHRTATTWRDGDAGPRPSPPTRGARR
ncbi:hypothetical protein GS939_07775, partial [Rhodococcus hoagii]|nr:hypothetical protein [Prescottella equi]